jgi:fructuronate reductase
VRDTPAKSNKAVRNQAGQIKLTRSGLLDRQAWEEAGVKLPGYDVSAVAEETIRHCGWIHFGAGNLFRAYPAMLQQRLIRSGDAGTGILAVVDAVSETPEKIYAPYDHLSLAVTLDADGRFDKEVLGCIADVLWADPRKPDWQKLVRAFCSPDLQIATFTVTEKGYATHLPDGTVRPELAQDLKQGPEKGVNLLTAVTALLFRRYRAGGMPLALVSLDNCAQNGRRLGDAIRFIADAWQKNGWVDLGFIAYLSDGAGISFPWTMIDKITPYPSEIVRDHLQSLGIADMDILRTGRGSLSAPFVNAERQGYLVIEDRFPNGRPPLEQTGVLFTDRETVEKVEKMKVGTCLNPLHTALALLGCLLCYPTVASAMTHPLLPGFLRAMAMEEGMPVLEDPVLLDPVKFLDEVLEERLRNPFLPDTPKRIATDTSQKIPVRFGTTLQKYAAVQPDRLQELRYIPFVFACWLRYLLATDDRGNPMELSPDPRLANLRKAVEGIEVGSPWNPGPGVEDLLHDRETFGIDLWSAGLAEAVMELFRQMCEGPGAVEKVLTRITGKSDT